MTAVEQLLSIAKAEVGYLEKKTNSNLDSKTANAGSANYTKYARDLDNLGAFSGKVNGYAWCASFVTWCFYKAFGLTKWSKMTGIPVGGNGASCTSCVSYYKKVGRFYTSSPKAGDQIFFKTADGTAYAHTGIVYKVSGNRVYTYEGNTSGASGVVANGGGVVAKDYALSYARIGGYGRPDYSLATSTTTAATTATKTTTTTTTTTTKKEEDDIMTGDQIVAALQNNPKFGALVLSALQTELDKGGVSPAIQTELNAAKQYGITDGTKPTRYVTRAQAAVMAKRAMEKVSK